MQDYIETWIASPQAWWLYKSASWTGSDRFKITVNIVGVRHEELEKGRDTGILVVGNAAESLWVVLSGTMCQKSILSQKKVTVATADI